MIILNIKFKWLPARVPPNMDPFAVGLGACFLKMEVGKFLFGGVLEEQSIFIYVVIVF